MNLTLPGFNYLGPGNPLESGTPTNKADAIARTHDYEYDAATSKEDIYKSDLKAIGNFSKNLLTDWNPISRFGSTVGAIGLGIKTTVERVKGDTIYPNNKTLAEKRKAVEALKVSDSKRMAENMQTDIGGNSGQDIAMAADASGGASSGIPSGNTYFYSGGKAQETEYTELNFSKMYRFHASSYAPQYRKVDAQNSAALDKNYIQYKPGSCWRMPVEFLWAYLSEGEFEALKKFQLVTVESTEVLINSVGVRMPFITNEATAMTANATAQIPIYCLKPEFSKYNLLQYDRNQLNDVRSKMHGDSPDTWTVSNTFTPVFTNISARVTSRKFDLDTIIRYYAPITAANADGSNMSRRPMNLGQPSFHEWKGDVLNGSAALGPFCAYSYKPKNNVAWIQNSNIPAMQISPRTATGNTLTEMVPTGVGKTNIIHGQNSVESTSAASTNTINQAQGIIQALDEDIEWATKLIEDPRFILHQQEFQNHTQPAFCFGMDFLRNNDGTILDSNWEMVVQFNIKLKCHIKTPGQYPLTTNNRYSMGNFPAYNIGSVGLAGLPGQMWANNFGSRLQTTGGYDTSPWWNKPEMYLTPRDNISNRDIQTKESTKKRRID